MAITEERVENLLRNAVFTNSRHKEALRSRLVSEVRELSDEELEMVAGGVFVPESHLSLITDETEAK